jgi:hypothetical protein
VYIAALLSKLCSLEDKNVTVLSEKRGNKMEDTKQINERKKIDIRL